MQPSAWHNLTLALLLIRCAALLLDKKPRRTPRPFELPTPRRGGATDVKRAQIVKMRNFASCGAARAFCACSAARCVYKLARRLAAFLAWQRCRWFHRNADFLRGRYYLFVWCRLCRCFLAVRNKEIP